MISPVSAVIPDLLMVAAIWYHAYKIRLSNVMQVDVPYTTILLRDGTLYFIAMAVLLIVDIGSLSDSRWWICAPNSLCGALWHRPLTIEKVTHPGKQRTRICTTPPLPRIGTKMVCVGVGAAQIHGSTSTSCFLEVYSRIEITTLSVYVILVQ
ncbi:hypothetical protein C8Q72DRAFT_27343 [Fomitopsis betulina]|nr:hypothetical protein C8Q72DRAFT_27343 [Fomitopsis betulina]